MWDDVGQTRMMFSKVGWKSQTHTPKNLTNISSKQMKKKQLTLTAADIES